MTDCFVHSLICNIFISAIIGVIIFAKRLCKNILSSRMQYNLWILLFVLLAVPFLPLRSIGFSGMFSWLDGFDVLSAINTVNTVGTTTTQNLSNPMNWMNDFALSVSRKTPSNASRLLFAIWIIGMAVMMMLIVQSQTRLHHLKHSALPLQNCKIRELYNSCLTEMKITRKIPIYSTAFLKSPVIIGFLKPRIYLPIHLISDYDATGMRYMLLHELQHYKHKDALANYLMNLAGIVYWFNPFVWYALKQMRNDREIACDTSVLQMLSEDDYLDYGNTLLNFAEKISLSPFPFVAGISGDMKQMKQRILNIASYEKPSALQKLKSLSTFGIITVLLLGCIPMLSTYAADDSQYYFDDSDKKVDFIDLSSHFSKYDGSFVLYDSANDSWSIYNEELAATRVSPNSTYKIYSALLALEQGYITPNASTLQWNGQAYPFTEWNQAQTLRSAMQNSVNWYFQTLDQYVDFDTFQDFYTSMGYGNHDLSGERTDFWLESSLKISPLEQVELLEKLYTNELLFQESNIQAVKSALLLESTLNGNLYGKTGTGNINGQNINGWFIGFMEIQNNTYFFATNIQAPDDASGAIATEITLDILHNEGIY